jgi:hypothetical protein
LFGEHLFRKTKKSIEAFARVARSAGYRIEGFASQPHEAKQTNELKKKTLTSPKKPKFSPSSFLALLEKSHVHAFTLAKI